ncbi:N-formylglutamate amidohydrolase [Ostreibacterium oceani]|uniref:N-formylglutamate amidohydrolase n=1 Tax=Ostreibacterium oceani TaxID=2654998 RepID=A0A6N7EUV6_9GAMM|nr:N-formylglutamate amidohydrolase [Ostreibacterium oceani]MPV85219.1 N-formylglutamate amidohydrolase [Ostreibacterium oceani]
MTHINSPVSIINPNGTSDWLLVCEHASADVPDTLDRLGLTEQFFKQHIAYDIGAYEATLALSKKLNATAIVCHYSRLVIDCNRPLNAPDCIPATSDGVAIPGNTHLSTQARLWRINEIYWPFHFCVAQVLGQKLTQNPKTKFANIHSFTPMLVVEQLQRPWDIGFIYRDAQPTTAITQYLRNNTPYLVGDNEPYDGYIHKGYTVPAHADAQMVPNFLVEFRQDHINTASGVEHWTDVLCDAIIQTSDYTNSHSL